MKIYTIFKNNKLSVRSYNICRNNNLHSIKDLQAYYLKHNSFYNLSHCGKKSNQELVHICETYRDQSVDEGQNESMDSTCLKKIISELTTDQIELINKFIFLKSSSLPNRSRNAVFNYLKNNFATENFCRSFLYKENFIARNMNKVGVKSALVIDDYVETIKSFILEVSKYHDEKQLNDLKNKFKLFEETVDSL